MLMLGSARTRSVRKKERESVIINAVSGNDFVTTFVANGLQTWKWLSAIAVSQATIRVPISRGEMSYEKTGVKQGLNMILGTGCQSKKPTHKPRSFFPHYKIVFWNAAYIYCQRCHCLFYIYLRPIMNWCFSAPIKMGKVVLLKSVIGEDLARRSAHRQWVFFSITQINCTA